MPAIPRASSPWSSTTACARSMKATRPPPPRARRPGGDPCRGRAQLRVRTHHPGRARRLGKMTRTVAIIGALDTKGAEFQFVRNEIGARGLGTIVIDTGVLGEPAFAAD